VTGVLHLVNKTPADWFAKKQATVETATHGSEFVAARAATEQIIDLRTALHHLGVPAREKSHMFGDNKSVIDSATTPHAKLLMQSIDRLKLWNVPAASNRCRSAL
jgi:hypothetical protein